MSDAAREELARLVGKLVDYSTRKQKLALNKWFSRETNKRNSFVLPKDLIDQISTEAELQGLSRTPVAHDGNAITFLHPLDDQTLTLNAHDHAEAEAISDAIEMLRDWLSELNEKHAAGTSGKPRRNDPKVREAYGDHLDRDEYLFDNRSSKILPLLEAELDELSKAKGWTTIGRRGIREAIRSFGAHFGEPVPKGPPGRPRKTE